MDIRPLKWCISKSNATEPHGQLKVLHDLIFEPVPAKYRSQRHETGKTKPSLTDLDLTRYRDLFLSIQPSLDNNLVDNHKFLYDDKDSVSSDDVSDSEGGIDNTENMTPTVSE